MERELCPRCGGTMVFTGREKLQLGKYGLFLGHLSQLCSGAMAVDVYCCRDCKKLEFYAAETPEDGEDGEGRMAQAPCPRCGGLHEIDNPRCPRCGARLLE